MIIIGINVLSLCDGMSCGQIALERAKIEIDTYYASEINKHSIKTTQKNYPNTIQLGDMTELKECQLKSLPKIDLIMAGTPCQNLSIAVINNPNHNQGLRGEKSSLFYDYVRILKWLKQNNNPNIRFLFENVASMKNKDKDIITKVLGVEPLHINSNLVSAQDRDRYYWTNIQVKDKPKDKDIKLKDIMLSIDEVNNLKTGRSKIWYEQGFDFHGRDKKIIATLHIKGHDILKRVYNPNGKCATLTACRGGNLQKKTYQDGRVRKLTPIEYERLQTVPDNYTEGVTYTHRYNMLGDGWTVDVIAYILKYIKL